MDNKQRALEINTILAGKYMVLAVLGEGGFGITYLCQDLNVNVKVAIKEFFPVQFSTRRGITVTAYTDTLELYKKGLSGFVKEAETLAKYNRYPGIVSVNEFFYENNTAYIVMEYIEGINLNEYLSQCGGSVPWKEALTMVIEILPTLHLIHNQGIVHRDISPNNIMITKDNHVKLIDFGAARDIDSGKSLTVMLKQGYAPIEQYVSNGKQGPWTDVYSLCATIYKMVTGYVPQAAIDRQQGDNKLPNKMQCNCKLKKVLLKGMSIDPKMRYQTAKDLQNALDKVLHSKSKKIYALPVAVVGLVVVFSAIYLNRLNSNQEIQSEVTDNENNEDFFQEQIQDMSEEDNIDEQTEEYSRIFKQIPETELISAIEEMSDGYVYESFFDDFDSDGIMEMFALAVSNNIPLESMENNDGNITCTDWALTDHTAALYFANEDGARLVGDIIGMYDTSLRLEELVFGEGKCILLERRAQVEFERYLYAFYAGEIVRDNITSSDAFGTMGLFEYKNENGILYVKSNYSLQRDENYTGEYIRIPRGSSAAYYSEWIPFSYHAGHIYEQELQEVALEDFIKYGTAAEVLDMIDEQGKTTEIVINNSAYSEPELMSNCSLHNILYDGREYFYINYVYEGYEYSCETQPACNAKVILQNGELILDVIESGMRCSKVSFLPGFYNGQDGEIEYHEQTEEEAWIDELLSESNLSLIDYCYEDFNADGEYEMLGILSSVASSNESFDYNSRGYFQVPIEIWQVNKSGCNCTDMNVRESSIETYYLGYRILQFGEERQIELLDETIAGAGDAFKGIVIAVDESGNFYKSLEPFSALDAIDGVTYCSSGTDIIDTPYYGTGYDASLYYPIYYLNNQYYEMASVEIDQAKLNEIDNWALIESEIKELLGSDYIWPNCWRNYSCTSAKIDRVYFNEVGKIYVNYIGTETLNLDDYPDSYATAELTLKGNHIETYELLAGIREPSATDYEKMSSDISKMLQ